MMRNNHSGVNLCLTRAFKSGGMVCVVLNRFHTYHLMIRSDPVPTRLNRQENSHLFLSSVWLKWKLLIRRRILLSGNIPSLFQFSYRYNFFSSWILWHFHWREGNFNRQCMSDNSIWAWHRSFLPSHNIIITVRTTINRYVAHNAPCDTAWSNYMWFVQKKKINYMWMCCFRRLYPLTSLVVFVLVNTLKFLKDFDLLCSK